tara:strand:+ start:46 stop:213 length:168 start_codon:yes stop_codon:yes gene_type:complete
MENKMKDNKYHFLLGFATATLIAMVVSCSITPLEANLGQECGNEEWNPCWVKLAP